MKTPAWRRYLRFWRDDVVADVDEELRFHVEMRIEEYVRGGMSRDDARRAVLARVGDIERARSDCIDVGRVRMSETRQAQFMDALRKDLHYGLRSLRRTPGWTAVALLTIALGAGATTAVFRVVDALLLRPFAYPHADRVYIAQREFTIDGNTIPSRLPLGIVREWRAHARSIEAAVPYANAPVSHLTFDGSTVPITGMRVDAGFLDFAGARPLYGRNFTADEVVPNGPPVALLAEPFWRREFGASPEIIGRSVELDVEAPPGQGGVSSERRAFTIVGVVPAAVSIPEFRSERADLLLPFTTTSDAWVSVLVRLRAGVARESAARELDDLLQRAQLPDIHPVPGATPFRLTRPGDWLGIRQPIVMLAVAVALLLLVACTNVAHLLLARGAARQRELAMRHALGAGRARLVRQLVTETLLVAVLGAALAAIVAWIALRLLAVARPADTVALTYVGSDHHLLTVAAIVAIGASMFVGVVAGLRTAHRDLARTLYAGPWSTMHRGRRLQSTLVVSEIALSATLLVGALLLVHTVYSLEHTPLGFDDTNLYTVTLHPAAAGQGRALAEQAKQRIEAMPGVESSALAASAPGPHGWRMMGAYETPGHELSVADIPSLASTSTGIFMGAPNLLSVLRVPILQGRGLDANSTREREVVVSQSLARRLAPGRSPIGLQFRNAVARLRGAVPPWLTIVGVVPDVVSNLVARDDAAALFQPLDPANLDPANYVTVLVRVRSAATAAHLSSLATLPGQASAPEIASVHDGIEETMAEPRFVMGILAAFAGLGVVLAAIGLFGVISYSVRQRTREIGIRMSLGATRAAIASLVIGDAVRLSVTGIVAGIAGAAAASRLIRSQLHGVAPLDPFAFVVGAVALLTVAVVACAAPTLHAVRVDAADAVRAE